MPKTRLYRIILAAVNLGAIALASIDQWGPGIGITATQIAAALPIANLVIVLMRQYLDPTTPTLPDGGPVKLP